jgi:hypothetical protein
VRTEHRDCDARVREVQKTEFTEAWLQNSRSQAKRRTILNECEDLKNENKGSNGNNFVLCLLPVCSKHRRG